MIAVQYSRQFNRDVAYTAASIIASKAHGMAGILCRSMCDAGLTNQVEEHDMTGRSGTNGLLRLWYPFGRTRKGTNWCRALLCGKAGHAGVIQRCRF